MINSNLEIEFKFLPLYASKFNKLLAEENYLARSRNRGKAEWKKVPRNSRIRSILLSCILLDSSGSIPTLRDRSRFPSEKRMAEGFSVSPGRKTK